MDFICEYKKLLESCNRCKYSQTRIKVVPPEGPLSAEIVLIGEAPGNAEDRAGRPFIGRAGKKLDTQLERAGISRSSVIITNRVKCRPRPHGRPYHQSLRWCDRFLRDELSHYSPRIVIPLGNTALRFFHPQATVMDEHGSVYSEKLLDGRNIFLIPMYHPAHCIYNGDKIEGMTTDWDIFNDLMLFSLSIYNIPF